MNSGDQHRDKRQHARFDLLEYALVQKGATTETVRSVVIDVSLGGLQVRSRYQFDSGATYDLRIGRVSEEPLTVQAEVRYCIPIDGTDLYATGFRCIPADTKQRTDWVDYVHAVFQSQGEYLVG